MLFRSIVSAVKARFGEERRLVISCDDDAILKKLGIDDEDEATVEVKT